MQKSAQSYCQPFLLRQQSFDVNGVKKITYTVPVQVSQCLLFDFERKIKEVVLCGAWDRGSINRMGENVFFFFLLWFGIEHKIRLWR